MFFKIIIISTEIKWFYLRRGTGDLAVAANENGSIPFNWRCFVTILEAQRNVSWLGNCKGVLHIDNYFAA